MRVNLFILLALSFPSVSSGAVRVVTTTPAYADMVRRIGGRHVSVDCIMRGPENVHNVAARPSYIMKLRKAKLFIHSGLDAEPWAPLLLKGARKHHLLPGQSGYVDVSKGIDLKDVPKPGGLTRALGDIHVYGNTHYVLDPLNGVIVARTITDALKRADPAHAAEFEDNFAAYAKRLRELTKRLVEQMKPYQGTRVVTYHRTWPYFLDRFGLLKIAEVEPKPGISPGPKHLSECVEKMKAQEAKVVIVETFNSKKNAEVVARRAGGKAVVLAQEVQAVPQADTYEKLFEYNVKTLLAAFKEVGIEPKATHASTGNRAGAAASFQP